MNTVKRKPNSDFACKNCGYFVSTLHWISGVKNRNHCPTCLYSRHLDLFQPGDRLSACKGLMAPVGLTLKKSHDQYCGSRPGELMLVHCCDHCGEVSINRIAADDRVETIMEVYEKSILYTRRMFVKYQGMGIRLLSMEDHLLVKARLYGLNEQVIHTAPSQIVL
jgi:hypothetical protein